MKKKKITISLVALAIVFLISMTIYIFYHSLVSVDPGPPDFYLACRDVEIQAITLEDISGGAGTSYNLTLKRTGTGGEIGGVKIVLFNSTKNSAVLEWDSSTEDLDPLRTLTGSLDLTGDGVVNATKLDMTVYFVTDLGETELCPYTSSFNL